jgi:predicted ribosome quality control (RQC) complex YloA/Tae2 family protein
MTEDEKRINNIENRVSNLETKFEMFMQSHEDFKAEIRQQNQMRAEEIREIRQDMKNMQASLDAKIDSMGKHVRNLSVAAIAAVGGMFVAVGVMVGTLIYTLLTR